jgi:hypothetical protein
LSELVSRSSATNASRTIRNRKCPLYGYAAA